MKSETEINQSPTHSLSLSVCLSVYLPVCVCVCVCVWLSVYLYVCCLSFSYTHTRTCTRTHKHAHTNASAHDSKSTINDIIKLKISVDIIFSRWRRLHRIKQTSTHREDHNTIFPYIQNCIDLGTDIIEPRREKTCLRGFANRTGADQPSHQRNPISAFVIHFFGKYHM